LGFSLGFGVSFYQDQERVLEMGRMAWTHLHYALELKDDMAVIDWSKNLEKMDSVLAFKATADSKPVAEGGNRNFLSTGTAAGPVYRFPSHWVFTIGSPSNSAAPKELTVVFKFRPGPPGWGFLMGGLALLTGIIGLFLMPAGIPERSFSPHPATDAQSPKPSPKKNIEPEPSKTDPQKPYLFLDKNYVIQQSTPEAAKLFQKTVENLLNVHLLDLEPDPTLMSAIGKSEEVRLKSAFTSRPHLSVSLKTDPNGTLLFLEVVE
jgi:hypothetical protein